MMDKTMTIKGLIEAVTVLEAHVPKRFWGASMDALHEAIDRIRDNGDGFVMGKGRTIGKWIDVNVIPPPICDTFIVRLEPDGSIPELLPEVDIASIDIDGDWMTFNDWEACYKPTHWMPLPYPDLE